MRRREFLGVLGSATVTAWPLATNAQQTKRVPRIGWLSVGSPSSHRFSLTAFRDGLSALNYVEGQNVAIEYRWAEGDPIRLRELANQLVQQKVDVILAGGSIGVQAAKDATSVIPIVAAGAGDLIELGLVKSLARPGGNLTGFVMAAQETAGKRLQIMIEMVPQGRRAAVLWNPGASNAGLELKVVKELASAVGLIIAPYEARTLQDLDNALAAIARSGADMLIVMNDPFMFTHRKTIVESAGKFRIPANYGFREYVDDGGLISYGPNISDSYRRAALYVDRILKGEKSGDLPVQLPTKYETVLNLKTAKALGLDVPASVLVRADEVIE